MHDKRCLNPSSNRMRDAHELTAVMTTIQPPTDSVRTLNQHLLVHDAELIVVGDEKGPWEYDLPGCTLLDLNQQRALPHKLARLLPVRHYARKNLGYLEAIAKGSGCIYETDDDNAPLARWTPRTQSCNARMVGNSKWLNVYRLFSDDLIWPRGLPLDRILVASACEETATESDLVLGPIQQGLANGSPDVDAVWRLVLDRDFRFLAAPSVRLRAGTWCPFNSQTTWWWPVAYPLMYLPSFCSFRMTDIWRSFIAQRCLWELDLGIVFHAAEVVQQRNVHNLMRDFKDEVPGYLENDRLVDVLIKLPLLHGAEHLLENIFSCYEALVAAGFFPSEELKLVRAWVEDVATIGRKPDSMETTAFVDGNDLARGATVGDGR
jgi:hypothetical protein